MPISYSPMPTADARALQRGGPDANGQPAEHSLSNGPGNICRHCLTDVPEGQPMLIFALRPFASVQPYAETGPAFLCADECTAYADRTTVPSALFGSPDYLIKGYGAADRIIYGTGRIVPTSRIPAEAEDIFTNPDVAYVHVRSARNNCWQGRIDRA